MDDSVLATHLSRLQRGNLDLVGLLDWGSNYTFLVNVCDPNAAPPDAILQAVYKPQRGERPLWDFRRGTLHQREYAAFLVSELLGWRLVPPTVIRDGPHGAGSVQLFIEHDPEIHYFTFQGQFAAQLQRIVLYDAITNNADRKSGHVLLGKNDRLWSIDHGICFHTDYKLRSVVWDFAGEPIPETLRDDMGQFLRRLDSPDDASVLALRDLLAEDEVKAVARRTQRLVDGRHFPRPGPGRHYPWPPV